jgi:hypothetical protein
MMGLALLSGMLALAVGVAAYALLRRGFMDLI